MRLFSGLLLLMVLSVPGAHAASRIQVALISDGEHYQLHEIEAAFKQELLALTEGEFDVEFRNFQGNWTLDGIREAFTSAYRDPGVDMVLAVGVVANQIGIGLSDYPKPTFVPLVFDAQLAGAPAKGKGSGKTNLNYLTDRVDFSQDLKSFKAIVPFQKMAFIADEVILSAIPELIRRAEEIAANANVAATMIAHDGQNHRVAEQIPQDIDVVMVAGLPRMPTAELETLINSINQRRLPSYSLIGLEGVTRGLLAADAQPGDWGRLARRNALNMQAVMLGENAEDQQIRFAGKRELTINMETAREIGLSPRFDVLSEAVLLNEQIAPQGPEYSLLKVAALAVEQNLDLSAERQGVAAGEQDIFTARARQLPQLGLGSSISRRKVSPFVQMGQFPEKSSDASISVDQLIYSDDVAANVAIQKNLQAVREQALQNLRLDIVQQATTAFLNVLRADTQLAIFQNNLKLTRTNLELAQDRVRVGSTSAADVYRWESRLATDRSSLLTARASLERAREALNRLLHRPLTEQFQIIPVSLEDPFFMTEAEFNALVDNPRNLKLVTEFSVGEAIKKSPELRQLDEQIMAKEREVINHQRSYWLPDFSLSGGYSKNLGQSGTGAGLTENLGDWNVGLSASIPLFAGGARKSALSRARYELEQLEQIRNSSTEKIEQQVRASYHLAYAAYVNIELSKQAASSAEKNLDLVTDSYARGLVSIIELLDAQNASLTADESAANALYDFLITIMDQQRAGGEYSFLLPVSQRQQIKNDMQQYISTGLER